MADITGPVRETIASHLDEALSTAARVANCLYLVQGALLGDVPPGDTQEKPVSMLSTAATLKVTVREIELAVLSVMSALGVSPPTDLGNLGGSGGPASRRFPR